VDGIVRWFSVNMLALNVGKTHAMLFTLNNYCHIPPVVVNDVVIKFVQSVKFLGCYLDSQLKWQSHVDHVCRSLSRGIALLRTSHTLFPKSVKSMMYYSFIYSYIAYCIQVWGNAADVYTVNIVTLQKRAIRLVANASRLAHSRPLAYDHKFLLFDDVYKMKCACTIFKSLNVRYQSNILPVFNNVSTQTGRVLRNRSDLSVLYARTCKRQNSFICSGIRIWNLVPLMIRSVVSFALFKSQLRSWLISSYVNLQSF
jgi:hypothetical protein